MMKVSPIKGFSMRPVTLGDIERLADKIQAALDDGGMNPASWIIKHRETIRDVISSAMDGDKSARDSAISKLPTTQVFPTFYAALGCFGFEAAENEAPSGESAGVN